MYRAIFTTLTGTYGLDFNADNMNLARAHAVHVASAERMLLVKVVHLREGEAIDPGTFFPVSPALYTPL